MTYHHLHRFASITLGVVTYLSILAAIFIALVITFYPICRLLVDCLL